MSIEWADYIQRGRKWRKANDDANWGLGDDVVQMTIDLKFDPKPGRPAANSNVRTLSDYAAEVDISARRVSECFANSKFYGELRQPDMTFAHHDLARRNANGDIEEALTLLETARKLKLHYRAFVRHIKGILYEGTIEADKLPADLRSFIGDRRRVWISIEEEDDE